MRTPLGFVGFSKSDKYLAGCSVQSVYLFEYTTDESGEIVLTKKAARFDGFRLAFHCLFSPSGDTLAIHDDVGAICLYSMEGMELIRRIEYGKWDQDDGFCFSHDGKKLYVIERICDGDIYSRIISFSGEDFSEYGIEFESKIIQLFDIACAEREGEFYVNGYMRNRNGFASVNFIAKLYEGRIADMRFTCDHYAQSTEKDSNSPGLLAETFKKFDACRGTFHRSVPPYEHCLLNVRFDQIRCASRAILSRTGESCEHPYSSDEERDAAISELLNDLNELKDILTGYGEDFPFPEISHEVTRSEISSIHNICKYFLDSQYRI